MEKLIKCTVDTVGYSQKPTGAATAIIQKRFKENPATHLKEMTSFELLYKVGEDGYSFKPAVFHEGGTGNDHFKELHIIAIDIDTVEGWSISHTQDRLKLYDLDYVGIYKSFSYTEDKQKHRIIFELPEVITDRRMVSLLYLLFMQVLPSDKQCIDPARLYFGGKGVIEGTTKPLNLASLYTAFMNEVGNKTPKQKFDTLQDIASKVGLNIVNGVLDIDIVDNNIVPNWTMESLTFKQRGKRTNTYEDVDKSYSPQSITAKYGYEEMNTDSLADCKLFSGVESGNHWIYHHELFPLVTNLFTIKGVVERLSSSLGQYPNKGQLQSKLKTAVTQCAKAEYLPQNCNNNVCPYFEVCNIMEQGYKNPYDYLKNSRLSSIEYVGSEGTIEWCNANQMTQFMAHDFAQVMEQVKQGVNGVWVFKVPTGVGKTQMLTEYDWTSYNGRVGIAFPNHDLKEEVAERSEGNFWNKPKKPDIEDVEVEQEIQDLYNRNLTSKARKVQMGYYRDNMDCNEEYKAFIHDIQSTKYQNLVATTHADVLMNGGKEYDLIISDEDILKTSMEVIEMSQDEFEAIVLRMSKHFTTDKTNLLKQFLDSFEGDVMQKIDLSDVETTKEEQEFINDTDKLNYAGVYGATVIVKGKSGKRIYMGKRLPFPNKPIIILSATAHEGIYRELFPQVEFYDYLLIGEGGKLVQYLDNSYTRTALKEADVENIAKDIENIILENGGVLQDGKYNFVALTYKDTTSKKLIEALEVRNIPVDRKAYFGKAIGQDHLKGKNIILIGTPNVPEIANKMVGLMLFGDKVDLNSEFITTEKQEVNGFKVRYGTFNDPLLKMVQSYNLESELLQAVGRARLSRGDNKAILLSRYPLKEADLIHFQGKTINRRGSVVNG